MLTADVVVITVVSLDEETRDGTYGFDEPSLEDLVLCH